MSAPEVTLLPCPFCGGEAESDYRQPYRALSSGRLGNRFAIYCTSCDADIGFCYEDIESSNHEGAIEQTIAAWNTRQSATAPLEAQIAELVEALRVVDKMADLMGEYTIRDAARAALTKNSALMKGQQ